MELEEVINLLESNAWSVIARPSTDVIVFRKEQTEIIYNKKTFNSCVTQDKKPISFNSLESLFNHLNLNS